MQPGKGYSITIETTTAAAEHRGDLVEGRVAVTPMGEGVRIGGTMGALAGLRQGVDDNRVRGIWKSMARYYPDFQARRCPRRAGVVRAPGRCRRDGLPYLGRPKHYDNLTVAAGHAMVGLSLGPITGKLVSEISPASHRPRRSRLLDPDRHS